MTQVSLRSLSQQPLGTCHMQMAAAINRTRHA